MFGGYQGMFYSRTMAQWTGTDWKMLSPPTTPYPRSGAITVLDPMRHKVVLFGGISDNWIVQNTWTWDGANWTVESPLTQPPPLYFTTGGYDPSLGKVIVFGGVVRDRIKTRRGPGTGETRHVLKPSIHLLQEKGLGPHGMPRFISLWCSMEMSLC
jgi:hypothetical protein